MIKTKLGNKTEGILLKVSQRDKERIKVLAERNGTTISEYIRQKALNERKTVSRTKIKV